MRTKIKYFLVVASVLLFIGNSAKADLIVYKLSGVSSVLLIYGDEPDDYLEFTDKAFTFTATGDTDNVQDFGGVYWMTIYLVDFTIADVGSGSMIYPDMYVFSNPLYAAVGVGGDSDWVNCVDPSLATYDLTTAFGPVTGPEGYASVTFSSTTIGVLVLEGGNSLPIEFEAIISSVLEPATSAVFGVLALMGLVVSRRRKK